MRLSSPFVALYVAIMGVLGATVAGSTASTSCPVSSKFVRVVVADARVALSGSITVISRLTIGCNPLSSVKVVVKFGRCPERLVGSRSTCGGSLAGGADVTVMVTVATFEADAKSCARKVKRSSPRNPVSGV